MSPKNTGARCFKSTFPAMEMMVSLLLELGRVVGREPENPRLGGLTKACRRSPQTRH